MAKREFTPRKPDYHLSVMDKGSGEKGVIGAAWINDDGTVSIKVNSFVSLDIGKGDLVIMLYLVNGKPAGASEEDG